MSKGWYGVVLRRHAFLTTRTARLNSIPSTHLTHNPLHHTLIHSIVRTTPPFYGGSNFSPHPRATPSAPVFRQTYRRGGGVRSDCDWLAGWASHPRAGTPVCRHHRMQLAPPLKVTGPAKPRPPRPIRYHAKRKSSPMIV